MTTGPLQLVHEGLRFQILLLSRKLPVTLLPVSILESEYPREHSLGVSRPQDRNSRPSGRDATGVSMELETQEETQ